MILNLPRWLKRLIAVALDLFLCLFSTYLTFALVGASNPSVLVALAVSVCVAIPLFVVCGLYRAVFRYAGWRAMLTVCKTLAWYGLIFAGVFTFWGVAGAPRAVGLIQPLILFVTVGASRAVAGYYLGGRGSRGNRLARHGAPRVLIYGAGAVGFFGGWGGILGRMNQ